MMRKDAVAAHLYSAENLLLKHDNKQFLEAPLIVKGEFSRITCVLRRNCFLSVYMANAGLIQQTLDYDSGSKERL